MKKSLALFLLISALAVQTSPMFAADDIKRYQKSGEVLSVDPIYGQITIKHIREFRTLVGTGERLASNDGTVDAGTLFFVASKDLLKDIHKKDLIRFSVIEVKGDAQIDQIEKIGVAPDEKEGTPIGDAVQGVLAATGEAAKAVTSPIQPAHEVASATSDATTNTTGAVLDNATFPETKKKF